MKTLLNILRWQQRNKPARLNSKKVRWVRYSSDLKRLTVWNASGHKTVHEGISAAVYEKLLTADPPDFFYDTYIADAASPKSVSVRWLVMAVILILAVSVVLLERWT